MSEDDMKATIDILGEKLNAELDIPVSAPLDSKQSKFFKEVYTNPPRITTGAKIIKK
jgi:hypothetical protein